MMHIVYNVNNHLNVCIKIDKIMYVYRQSLNTEHVIIYDREL